MRETDEHHMESLGKELDKIKDSLTVAPATGDIEMANESAIRLNWTNFTTKTARKAITIGAISVILSACACSGFNIIAQNAYATRFYGFGGQSVWDATHVIFIALFAGVLLATQLVDHIGRKVCLNAKFSQMFCHL